MNKILKAYLVYLVGSWFLVGVSNGLLDYSKVCLAKSKAKKGEAEAGEYQIVPAVAVAIENFKQAGRLFKESCE